MGIIIICHQGAPESVIERCSYVRVGTDRLPMNADIKEEIYKHVRTYGTGLVSVSASVFLPVAVSRLLFI